MADAREEFERARADLLQVRTALDVAQHNYASARLVLAEERLELRGAVTTYELSCPLCGDVAGSFHSSCDAACYDQMTWLCISCDTPGKIDVDGDEDGCHVSFIPTRVP